MSAITSPGRIDFHVVPAFGGWALRAEGEPRYRELVPSQAEAIGDGVRLARMAATSLVVHGTDGRIREVRSY